MTFESLLHGRVSRAAVAHFEAGQYRHAALDAVVCLFDLLRERTGLDLDGDALATEALSLKRPRLVLADLTTESGRNAQTGLMMLLQGTYRGIRNTRAHSLAGSTDRADAAQILILCSYLAARIEGADLAAFIRHDGFYLCPNRDLTPGGARLLRFYADGDVISVSLSSLTSFEQIWSWFNRENAATRDYPSGRYHIDGHQLAFATSWKSGSIEYTGTIAPDRLSLEWRNAAIGKAGTSEYDFVSLATA